MKTVSNLVPNEKKQFESSVRAFLPRYALVPFRQHDELEYQCIVKQGDVVSEGQVIALSLNEKTQKKAYIHAPIPGTVISLEDCMQPDNEMGPAVKIRMEGAFSYLGKNIHQMEWQWYSRNELLDLIADKGVINTFDSSTPLYQQIARPDTDKNRYIVVRMFDDDPSHKTDAFVAQSFTKEVVEGSRILAKAIDAKGVVFVLSKKMNVQIDTEVFGSLPVLFVKTDGKKYPSGFKQNLVHIVRKASKSSEQEAFNSVNRFSLFVDPETLYSVYEAVVFGKPVLETFVHVEGSCLQTAAMLQVRIGTTIKSLVNQCGGFKTKPSKIIINGMITGCSVETLDTAITRGVKSVAFVPAKELNDHRQNMCVRCGKCRLICPEEIFPDLMYRHCNGGKKVGKDMIATSILCSGCGLCNSICPSRLPLCQTIEQLRKNEYENK